MMFLLIFFINRNNSLSYINKINYYIFYNGKDNNSFNYLYCEKYIVLAINALSYLNDVIVGFIFFKIYNLNSFYNINNILLIIINFV